MKFIERLNCEISIVCRSCNSHQHTSSVFPSNTHSISTKLHCLHNISFNFNSLSSVQDVLKESHHGHIMVTSCWFQNGSKFSKFCGEKHPNTLKCILFNTVFFNTLGWTTSFQNDGWLLISKKCKYFLAFFKKNFFGRHESFLWGHWYLCFGLLVMSSLSKPEIHLRCDTCQPLGGQHGSPAISSTYLCGIGGTRNWELSCHCSQCDIMEMLYQLSYPSSAKYFLVILLQIMPNCT